jgi:aspartyl-tRNA(Asn)/glutamyl-tRNA(Gln) amidotransferase subunit B
MLTKEIRNSYVLTVGIECHVQLKTNTKLFAAVDNNAREAAPNTLISHICLGMPGALPVLNERAVEYAMRVAFAFKTRPQRLSYFERKHYFYPDLPKGYQITQLSHPIVQGGEVEIEVDGQTKTVHINRVQIEEDAGKTTHPAGKDYSLVDLNRAGTPLLEIVSEPDIHSAHEAKAYVRELWLLMRYANVSDADLYHGNMRFDVNVSVSKDPNQLGIRTETKNLNSFKSVEKTVEYETIRQIELLEKGERIVQETRGWDDAKQKTISQRSKEDAHDYRYFPDPDIPPIELSDTAIEEIGVHMPPLPGDVRNQLRQLQLNARVIETLLDEMPAGQFIIELLNSSVDPKIVKHIANWLISIVQAEVVAGSYTWEEIKLDTRTDHLVKLASMQIDGLLSSTAAKQVLFDILKTENDPETIAKEKNLLQVSDESELAKIVQKVIADNPKAAEDVRSGGTKAIGFLVGQIMKASQGKANPGIVQQLIKKQLDL